mmetsp:Transcript_3520/g.4566  ORF Transcript_3520/g.4566 Transcript_3520/m.4566 type:complete len:716 (-) Transcript_3520:146-2293(-)|eukprot:CAMPEP_0117735822 /NCGR_PEP_ID=MMETSP0947-20121206/1542_1 /TAXON_ID=44440 /ORGANISM="Chattonella subsalsa, Strain CCMP2191" /LENGTH=715 /DNA_ID=CAMNT_0005550953 /DNA_START=118 /DNA_END=2265 /DNA_ORIENTATION=-
MRRHRQRIIAHVDMDCFYVEVERKLDASLVGLPVAVVQYDTRGDLRTVKPEENRKVERAAQGIIAVSYEARARGVKRIMSGDEAKKQCPELQLVRVPVAHGKADLTLYRNAGAEVAKLLAARASKCEKASIDEVYVEVTEEAHKRMEDWLTGKYLQQARGSHVAGEGDAAAALSVNEIRMGHKGDQTDVATFAEFVEQWWARPLDEWSEDEMLLVCGASIISELRAQITKSLGYTCSAGIAHNKMLGKLASAMHKPNQQTLVPSCMVPGLLKTLAISRIRLLGAKLGEHVQETLGISTVGELSLIPEQRLQTLFGEETGHWLWQVSHGIDVSEVQQRVQSKSISCGKTFRGRNALRSLDMVEKWIKEFASEIQERLEEDMKANKRRPTTISIGFTTTQVIGEKNAHISRRSKLHNFSSIEHIAGPATLMIKKWIHDNPNIGIISLSVGVSEFEALSEATQSITSFMHTTSNSQNSKGEDFSLLTASSTKRKRPDTKNITAFFSQCQHSQAGSGTNQFEDGNISPSQQNMRAASKPLKGIERFCVNSLDRTKQCNEMSKVFQFQQAASQTESESLKGIKRFCTSRIPDIPDGFDPTCWEALPNDIQKEIRLDLSQKPKSQASESVRLFSSQATSYNKPMPEEERLQSSKQEDIAERKRSLCTSTIPDGFDEACWKELPEEIQKEVLREIEMQKPAKSKPASKYLRKGGIKRFFKTK